MQTRKRKRKSHESTETENPSSQQQQQQQQQEETESVQLEEAENISQKIPIKKVLTQKAVDEKNRQTKNSGIVYLSRIPTLMSHQELRNILSKYGELGKVYLIQLPGQENKNRKYILYKEGWVEFKSKKIAKTVAEELNAQTIGMLYIYIYIYLFEFSYLCFISIY